MKKELSFFIIVVNFKPFRVLVRHENSVWNFCSFILVQEIFLGFASSPRFVGF